VRQDDAVARHGRIEHRPAHDRRFRRADALGWYRGERIGSGTNTWSLSEDLRAGKITQDEFHEAEAACTAPTATA
jgi:hypothetical protein